MKARKGDFWRGGELTCLQKRNIKLSISLLFLNVMDVASTHVLLSRGGMELNPIMAPLFDDGPWLPLLIKVVITLFLTWVSTWNTKARTRRNLNVGLRMVIVIYFVIVMSNIAQILGT